MKLDFIWITDYKSIEERTKLKIDSSVTAVIGKNESGKSNLIDILGSISLINGLPPNTYKNIPQGAGNAKMVIDVECSFSDTEIQLLGLKSNNKQSLFCISKEYEPFGISISGGIQEYFNKEEFQSNLEIIGELLKKYKDKIKNFNSNNIEIVFNYLRGANNYIVPDYLNHLNRIKEKIIELLSIEEKTIMQETYDYLKNYFERAYNMFPKFYKYVENSLLSEYKVSNDFLEKDSPSLGSLKNLLIASGCSIDDIRTACIDHPDNGRGMDAKEKIKNSIKTKVEKGFNDFYKQEENVSILADMSRNRFSLYIKTDGPILSVSERSQGLKWYLNLYVDILANNLENENIIFLIDEPGVYLHVDAQKKVLELFDDLSRDDNQIVYTTHSPFMLNENRLDRIRTVQKNTKGSSQIITSILSEKIDGLSKSESLSPLISALGMKIYQNIGMTELNMNIITEGYSDAIYLDVMANKINIKGMKFIPSIGASNVVYLTNILWGWGFQFKALFDSDNAGVNGRKAILKSYGFKEGTEEAKNFESQNIIMIEDVLSKSKNETALTIESLIDDEDYKKINKDYSSEIIQSDNSLKVLFSNLFADAVTKGEIELSDNTVNNFKRLFEKLSEE
ncbi:AAA family ATPase [Corticicoccus populi]|uniref:AAA family ATPase n=1 Tax=Corticicoccus populi TaxID=1812821 RepID=A0ABW5WSL9_9STAP